MTIAAFILSIAAVVLTGLGVWFTRKMANANKSMADSNKSMADSNESMAASHDHMANTYVEIAKNDSERRQEEREPLVGFGWRMLSPLVEPTEAMMIVTLLKGDDVEDASISVPTGGPTITRIQSLGEMGRTTLNLGLLELGVSHEFKVWFNPAGILRDQAVIFTGHSEGVDWKFAQMVSTHFFPNERP